MQFRVSMPALYLYNKWGSRGEVQTETTESNRMLKSETVADHKLVMRIFGGMRTSI